MTDTLDLGGPLPEVDVYNKNQHRSLTRLNSTLIDDLRFRDERIDDFGVDGTIEVHLAGKATNIRSDVQLKSRERDERNADNSLSFKAEVPNLVYLLNGRSPLYVIYVLDTDTLLYLWVRDEIVRIEADNATWKDQGHVTVRFRTVLDASACEELRDRILREGVLRRQVSEFVSKAAGGTIQLSIDTATFKVAKRDDIASLIAKHGIALVSSGAPQEVMEKASGLTSTERELPAVALSLGYAEYTRGRYAASDGHLAAARLRESELAPKQRVLLLLLSNACDLEFGRITRDEYLTNEAKIVGDTGPLARQLKAKVLWDAYLADRHPDRVEAFVASLQALLDESVSDANDSAENRFQLRMALLTARTEALVSELLTINAQGQIADRIDLTWTPQARKPSEWKEQWSTLLDQQTELAAEAIRINNPMLMGRAKALLALAEFQRLLMERLMAVPLETALPDQKPQIYSLMPAIDAAQQLATSVGDIEESIRLTLRLADMYMALGNDDAAKGLAAGALARARALRLGRLVDQAEALTRGEWFVRTYEEQLRAVREQDDDELLAAETDEAIDTLARSTVHTMGLPSDRLGAIRADHEAMRLLASERLSFCKHLGVKQNLEHTLRPETFYAEAPDQVCHCALYDTESTAASKDARRLVQEFKAQVCNGCSSRSPKKRS